MKNIAIIPNFYKDVKFLCTKKVLDYLLKSDCEIYIPQEYKEYLKDYEGIKKVLFADDVELYSAVELIISIGGDGTILKISHNAASNFTPILGINMGTVGFMTELEISELELLDSIFTNDYVLEHRMMLDVEVRRKGQVIASFCALNDAVLSKGVVSKLIEIDLCSNNTAITCFRADGLILATPTGSTAYSLSSGGSIIDPSLECICVTPIVPHSFTNSRPIVFSPDNIITIKTTRQRDEQVFLTVDGLDNIQILYGDQIQVKKSHLTTKLVRIKNLEFYDAVYKKLSERR